MKKYVKIIGVGWDSGAFPTIVNYKLSNCLPSIDRNGEGNKDALGQVVEMVENVVSRSNYILCKDVLGRMLTTKIDYYEKSTEEEWLKQFPQTLFNIFN